MWVGSRLWYSALSVQLENFGKSGPVQDSGTDPIQDSGTDPMQDSGSHPMQDSGSDPMQDSGSDPGHSLCSFSPPLIFPLKWHILCTVTSV